MIRRVGAVGAAVASGVALAVIVAACGGAKQQDFGHIDQRKQQISQMSAKIQEWRQEMGLEGIEPPRREILRMHNKPMESAKAVCPDRVEPTATKCTDVCSIADAICDNAEKICRIADELVGDSWAQDKCSSAKASCKEAKQECCRCRDGQL